MIERDLAIRAAQLVAALAFILCLKMLSSPRTALVGNRFGALGMLVAIVATVFDRAVLDFGPILLGIVAGSAIGLVSARRVQMTEMPQMVALFNGAGGLGSAIVSAMQFVGAPAGTVDPGLGVSIALGALIGAVALSGSVVAYAKLQGLVYTRAFRYGLQQPVNALLVLGILASGAAVTLDIGDRVVAMAVLIALSTLLGVAVTMPIGGADMPVVICLMNTYSGLAVAATGFVLSNQLLIIGGALVGASGVILTVVMSKAMNRSLGNILFGAFGSVQATAAAGQAGDVQVRTTTTDDAAALVGYARSVVLVPGYGMAVAQAQHEVHALEQELESRGVKVTYAIHPVAGRMPGHMNVLLAEADVDYEKLKDMDEINPEFPRTDVALVIGANDVTNPAARSSPGSPIYGMPILDVDKATNVIVIKRSMRPGFAGIDNDLYLDPKCALLFGDAKAVVSQLVAAVKAA